MDREGASLLLIKTYGNFEITKTRKKIETTKHL